MHVPHTGGTGEITSDKPDDGRYFPSQLTFYFIGLLAMISLIWYSQARSRSDPRFGWSILIDLAPSVIFCWFRAGANRHHERSGSAALSPLLVLIRHEICVCLARVDTCVNEHRSWRRSRYRADFREQ